jgi:hypothetical protein
MNPSVLSLDRANDGKGIGAELNNRENVMIKSIFKARLMIFSGLMLVAATNAQAQPVCKTISECQALRTKVDALRTKVDARISELRAGQLPTFLDIPTRASGIAQGRAKLMNYRDAVQYCSSQGARLPSARELARYSMSLGAKGFPETGELSKGEISFDYVEVVNADGTEDSFYFSRVGYQTPAGHLRQNAFWSSSVYSGWSTPPYLMVVLLRGVNGGFGEGFPSSSDWEKSDENAVLCVSDR